MKYGPSFPFLVVPISALHGPGGPAARPGPIGPARAVKFQRTTGPGRAE